MWSSELARSAAAGADRVPDGVHDQGGTSADEELACARAQRWPAVEQSEGRADREQGDGGQDDRGDQRGGAGAEQVGKDNHDGAEGEGDEAGHGR
ncbi:hypothetical protein FHR32_003170 [Streptosporangium album]|uniref:Uncharacterized protein n=1 Tax=Streptosporangium album TaxID=47479 RepID=A0A7W7WA78_9ACTN|nr:hypothetical protein [Streptosporangium album]MBB4938865.1 hypothetical protein [Streptosporangium album]